MKIFIAKSLAKYWSDWQIEPLVWPSTAMRKTCPCYDGLLILKWLAVYFEWEIIGTRYFSFRGTSNPRSWYDAQADCKRGGGILASIHSGDEVTALVQFLSDRFVKLWSWFCGHDCNPDFLVKSDIFTLSFSHTHTHTHTHSAHNTHNLSLFLYDHLEPHSQLVHGWVISNEKCDCKY